MATLFEVEIEIEIDSTICLCFRLDHKLVSTDTNGPFEFNHYADQEENQKRYETIGKLIDEKIFDLLENECHLDRVTIPVGILLLERFFRSSIEIRFRSMQNDMNRRVLFSPVKIWPLPITS